MDQIAQFIAQFSLFGIPALLVVTLLVQAIKTWVAPDMPPRALPFLVLGVSLVVTGATALIDVLPGAEPFVKYGFLVLALWLGSMGAYSGAKTLVGK